MRNRIVAVSRWFSVALVALFALLAQVAPASAQTCPTQKSGTKYKAKVESAPPGATVYLDRKECGAVGVTPWNGTLPAGTYTVIVESDGYNPETKPLKVLRSRTASSLFVALVKKAEPPRIEIRGDADRGVFGAQVFVDGQAQGQAPTIVTTVAGRHLIELRKEGYETLSQWLEVKENQTATLSPQLKAVAKPNFGTVVVEADVAAAEVFLDGNKHPDATPTVIANVVEGVHVIEVRKAPAIPWKQTIQVTANQQTKVRAELASTLNGQGGTVRVLTNVSGASVFIDGTDMGPAPVDIKDVKPGVEHVVEVKAKGYQTRTEKVLTNAGQSQVLKLDLNAEAATGQATLKVISQVPDADVYIDGAAVGKAPQEKRIDAGNHKVLVKLNGYKEFTQDIRLEGGQTMTVTADLKAVGRLRILSTPDGANVLINGLQAGKTPLDTEVEVGATIVRVGMPGRVAQERNLNIVGGKTETISMDLPMEGKTDVELAVEQRSLSSFGARTLPRGRSTVDVSVGYPYYMQGRINVGAGRLANFGFDAGVTLRTMFARQELGFGGRLMVADKDPFSAALFTDIYWGSPLFDDSKRNGMTWDVGAIASLTAMTHVTITVRGYLNMWSDRHCPEVDTSGKFDGTPRAVCKNYYDRKIAGQDPAGFTADDLKTVEQLSGQSGRAFFSRDQGARFMLAVGAEIALRQQWNVFGILEGAPFQDERALFTNYFSKSMFSNDIGLYFRAGLTHKF